jgi:hypothetical protein
MADPYTIHYGPWSPDLANVAVEFSRQFSSTDVPCADCLNVYYADGCYRSLPSAVTIASLKSVGNPPYPATGAFTGIDASGAPFPIVGTQEYAWVYQNGAWVTVGSNYSAIGGQWRFAQFGQSIYAVSANAVNAVAFPQVISIGDVTLLPAGLFEFTGSITANVLTVTAITGTPLQVGTVLYAPGITSGTNIISLGSGTGGLGTYNLTTTPNLASTFINANLAPYAQIVGVSGQFLIYGNISVPYSNSAYGTTAYQFGTGNGSTKTFTGTIPNTPLRKSQTYVYLSDLSAYAYDNGAGSFTSPYFTGTINYATGAISVTFLTPPASSVGVLADYTQVFAARVWWSAIDLPNFFPAPFTNAALAFQSSLEDLEADLGPVTAIVGYPLYFLVFQQNGITRAIYQGGNVVFAFGTYEWKRGLIACGAYVQVGPNVYFLSDQGFFYTDGANVIPIGTAQDNSAGIDNWFWANANLAQLSTITGAYDATLRSVIFAVATGTNTQPDTLLIYNLLAQRWTRAQVPSAVIWSDDDGSRHRLGIMTQGTTPGYQRLTGTPLSGYLESCDMYFIDGQRRLSTAARPLINCTDQPLVTIGNRDDLKQSVKYAAGSYPDRFSKLNPCLSGGMYTRARVTSAQATSIHGVTLYLETEGPM